MGISEVGVVGINGGKEEMLEMAILLVVGVEQPKPALRITIGNVSAMKFLPALNFCKICISHVRVRMKNVEVTRIYAIPCLAWIFSSLSLEQNGMVF